MLIFGTLVYNRIIHVPMLMEKEEEEEHDVKLVRVSYTCRTASIVPFIMDRCVVVVV